VPSGMTRLAHCAKRPSSTQAPSPPATAAQLRPVAHALHALAASVASVVLPRVTQLILPGCSREMLQAMLAPISPVGHVRA
jgi:hypothetical protein